MANLKGRIEELECIIEEESMRTRRERNTIRLETKRLVDHVVQQSQQEVKRRRVEFAEILKSKEQEHQNKQNATIMKMRELEHELALKEKELQEKELYPSLESTSTQPVANQQPSEPSADSGSSIPSLQGLLTVLYPYAFEWKKIGMLLGFEPAELKRIESDNGNAISSLHEVVSIRMKNLPHLSWSAIAEIFEAMSYEETADRLRIKYSLYTRLTEHNHGDLVQHLSDYSDQWREIGTCLLFMPSELNDLESAGSPERSLSEMLSKWLQWAPEDYRGSTNFATIEAFNIALRKAFIFNKRYLPV